jgi:DNA replication and repair protein RecF
VIQSFDDAFLAQAATVDACRQTYTEALFSEVENLMGDFLTQHNISLHYYRGWGQDKDLPTLLDENFKKDIDAGFTQYGPHRADIRLRVGTALAQDVLSRGQQKRLIFSLTLAQATLYQAHQNQACVLLLDDVHAELDAQHFEALLGQAMALSMQVVMTSVNPDITSKLPSDQFTLISL